jgi:hypothetical protein
MRWVTMPYNLLHISNLWRIFGWAASDSPAGFA